MKPLAVTWRLIVTEPADGALNMAVDELLAEGVRSGESPAFRLYSWSLPCLSLGRNQPAVGRYDVEALRSAGIGVVRRPTGGRAVLHDAEVTYSVAAPARAWGSARRAYRAINEVLLEAIASLGGAAHVHPADQRPLTPLSTTPCFAEPAPGEVVADGRKLIGSAQLCERGVLLQHGSIPLRRSRALDRLPVELRGLIDGRPAHLENIVGIAVPPERLEEAVSSAWRGRIGAVEPGSLTEAEVGRAEVLAGRYRSDEWTWRQ
ncbi:MAG: octanoyltransferase [Gemmatimonas sp.]|nr:octanoyltransferase [Gemmatimonas sp.]